MVLFLPSIIIRESGIQKQGSKKMIPPILIIYLILIFCPPQEKPIAPVKPNPNQFKFADLWEDPHPGFVEVKW